MYKQILNNHTTSEHHKNRYIKFISHLQDQLFDVDQYTENHHILPRSLYPEYKKEKWNIITLTARQHFIAHWMLANIFGGKMWTAIHMMVNCDENGKRDYKIFSRLYEKARKEFSEGLSENWSGEKNPMFKSGRFGKLNPMYGKNHSEETRRKISETKKRKFEEDPDLRLKYSGENNAMYGKKHTDEFKKNMSDRQTGVSRSEETRRKISESQKGRVFSDEHKRNLSESLRNSDKLKGKKPPSQSKNLSAKKKGSKRVYRKDGSFFVSLKENLYKYHYRDNKYYDFSK